MKMKPLYNFGRFLMKLNPVSIIIIDDMETYFNKQMLSLASTNGDLVFERYYKIDEVLLKNLCVKPRDIVILDIKGITDPEVAKDGFDVAKHLLKNTSSYIAVTSAHKFQLKNRENYGDYIIQDRLMTPVDFCDEINSIVEDYLKRKTKFYSRIVYKIGKLLFKKYVPL